MTIDLDAAIKTLEAHTPNDVICKKADLLGLIQRLREAEKEIAEARHEISCCDDINLDVPLAQSISDLQAHREHNQKDAARWKLASKSRNYGITCWNEYGQRTVYDDLAAGLIDAEIEQQRKIATGEDFGL